LKDAEKRLRQLIEAAEKEGPDSPRVQALRQVLADVQAAQKTAASGHAGGIRVWIMDKESGVARGVIGGPAPANAPSAGPGPGGLSGIIRGLRARTAEPPAPEKPPARPSAADEIESLRAQIVAKQKELTDLAARLAQAEQQRKRLEAETAKVQQLEYVRSIAEAQRAMEAQKAGRAVAGSALNAADMAKIAGTLDKIIERLDRIEKRLEGLENRRAPQRRIPGQGEGVYPSFDPRAAPGGK